MKQLIICALASSLFACSDCGDEGSSNADPNSSSNAQSNSANNGSNTMPNSGTGGNSGTGSENRLSLTFPPAGSGFPTITLAANNPVRIPLSFTMPPDLDIGQLVDVVIDAQQSADLTTITRTDGGTSPDPTVSLSFAIAPGSDTDAACAATPALDVTVTGNADFSEKTAEDTGSGPEPVLGTLNGGGDFSVCIELESSVNVEVELVGVGEFEFDADCADAPSDLSGVWNGDYTCSDSCGGDEGGPIELTVLQAGETGFYFDDGAAFYFGSVCGDQFRFVGGATAYSEWGHLDLVNETTSTKTSTWLSALGDGCGGDCTDDLTR